MENQQTEQVIAMMSEGYLASFRSIEKTLNRVANAFGVGWSGLSILNQIVNGQNVSMTDLTQRNHITKGAVSLQITELLNRNLIKISEDSNDRRRHVIELTKRGRTLAEREHSQAAAMALSVLETMGYEEMRRLHTDFSTFAQILTDTPIK